MFYNTLVKTFPDGHKQLHVFSRKKEAGYNLEVWDVPGEDESYSIKYYSDDDTGEVIYSEEKSIKHDGSSVERKEVENMSRAVEKIYDLARSNTWDWFLTVTFPGIVNTDYDACIAVMRKLCRRLTDRGCQYLAVPERFHTITTESGGGYHWHCLVKGPIGSMSPAHNAKTGGLYTTKSGAPVYNLDDSNDLPGLGWTTVSAIQDQARVASYLCKYVTKEIAAPKGRQRYLHSRGLAVPTVERLNTSLTTEQMDAYRYRKDCKSMYGNVTILEE